MPVDSSEILLINIFIRLLENKINNKNNKIDFNQELKNFQKYLENSF